MRKALVIIFGCILFGSSPLHSWGFHRLQSASSEKSDELVLVGTVTRLYPIATSRSQRRWAVVVRVDSVVSGEFTEAPFTFTVHSPARSGLRVNGSYVLKATRVDGGYVVNEFTIKEVRPKKSRMK